MAKSKKRFAEPFGLRKIALLSRSDQVPLTGGGFRGRVTPDLLKVKGAQLVSPFCF